MTDKPLLAVLDCAVSQDSELLRDPEGGEPFDVVIRRTTFFAGDGPRIVIRDGLRGRINDVHIWNDPAPRWYQVIKWAKLVRNALRYIPSRSITSPQWGVRVNDNSPTKPND